MKRVQFVSIATIALMAGGASFAAAPKKASSPPPPPPIATYWMDAATQSGFGAGMMDGGKRPGLGDIMGMMSGGGSSFSHTLSLRLASRTKPAGAPEADHFIPAGLQMGASLPLLTPPPPTPTKAEPYEPGTYQPKGRMLIYWGCGDHVAAGQPMVFDFAQMTSGKVPADIQRMAAMAGRMHSTTHSGPSSAPGFGEWPNRRDSRAVPAAGSLLGAHQVKATYAPEMDFTLGAGLDFMPPLGLMDAGAVASGADQLRWNLAPTATGYALAMFGATESGDMVMWSSSRSAAFANLDYLSPSDVAREIKAGNVLAPNISQCLLPTEVAQAVPAGMVMGIGYGPEGYFSDSPKAPKWTAKVRFKTNASTMRGMGAMMGGNAAPEQQPQQQPQDQPRKKRGFGLGGLIGAIPH